MTISKPRDIALVTSLVLSILSALSVYLYFYAVEQISPVWLPLTVGITVFLVSLVVVLISIEKFIYHRVRLIYRTINKYHNTQALRGNVATSEDPLEKASIAVESWAQDQIEEISALREKENFRREFIGNLAHELKTPVFNIQGYILTLLEGALEDPEINRKFLLKAANSLERLNTLLEDLDSISQIESGQYQFNPDRYNLTLQIDEVFESLERKAKKAKVSLKKDDANKRETFVFADKSRIEQVLINLIQNAINYGKENGITVVKVQEIGQKIKISIVDDGIGIDSIELPRIYERFYRVDKSRARNAGGSGLGLAIVKHILEGHKENIQVKSTLGKGSEFSFFLQKA